MLKLDISFEFVITADGNSAKIELVDQRAESYHTGKLPNAAIEDKLLEIQDHFSSIIQPYIDGQTTTHTSIHVTVNKPIKSPTKR